MEEIPDTKTIVWQFIFFLLMEDLFFYIGHSTLHRPQFYWIHKKHHEYANTVSIAAEYAHPIEHVFGNSLPTFIGYKVLSHIYPVHSITIWVFLTFRILETCDGHSGYEWSWAQSELLPFSAGSSYHNFHHSHNSGNYGSIFKIWDSLFGTNSDYIKFKLKNEGREKEATGNSEYKKVDTKAE
jgi:sterol desaturase/sphingolipid hydroxylase (fatty acid hydroxylase superfamily)